MYYLLAGCVITSDDFSRICVSLSCYCAQLGCGSVTAMLGICIPFFAAKFDVQCTDLAILLTLSGLGYFTGVQIVSKMLDPKDHFHSSLSSFALLSCSALTAGAVAFLLLIAENLWVVKGFIFIQVPKNVVFCSFYYQFILQSSDIVYWYWRD